MELHCNTHSGIDYHNDGSMERPLRTISHAVSVANGGDTICLDSSIFPSRLETHYPAYLEHMDSRQARGVTARGSIPGHAEKYFYSDPNLDVDSLSAPSSPRDRLLKLLAEIAEEL